MKWEQDRGWYANAALVGSLAWVAACTSVTNKPDGFGPDAQADAALSTTARGTAATSATQPALSSTVIESDAATPSDGQAPSSQVSASASAPFFDGGSADADADAEAGVGLPLQGCVSVLPSLEDGSTADCRVGHYACSQEHAYQCVEDADSGDECWTYAPQVNCPLWAETQCTAELDELAAVQPCTIDADCTLWGGLGSSDACSVGVGAPPLSISLQSSQAELEGFEARYAALLAGGCVADWGLDGTPHEAVCVANQCRAEQHSCLDQNPDGPDSGDSSVALDAARDADGMDAGEDAGGDL